MYRGSHRYLDSMVCCPRNASQHPECTPGAPNRPPDCIALLSASPEIGRDEVRNRHLVSSSGLPIEITYAPYEDVVLELEAAERPVLFYRWEADYLIVTNPGRFLRVDLTFAERCLPSGFGAVVHLPERDAQLCAPPPSPQPSPLPPRPACVLHCLPPISHARPALSRSLALSLSHTHRCDFHSNVIHKMAWHELRTGFYSDAWNLLSHFELSPAILTQLFLRTAEARYPTPSPTIPHHLPPSPTISHHLPPSPTPSMSFLCTPHRTSLSPA